MAPSKKVGGAQFPLALGLIGVDQKEEAECSRRFNKSDNNYALS